MVVKSKEAKQTIINVESQFDPESHMRCCGKIAEQRQIDYQITVQSRTFEIPNVWASVCTECDKRYFAPEVGDAIMDRIFEINHPKMALLGGLLRG